MILILSLDARYVKVLLFEFIYQSLAGRFFFDTSRRRRDVLPRAIDDHIGFMRAHARAQDMMLMRYIVATPTLRQQHDPTSSRLQTTRRHHHIRPPSLPMPVLLSVMRQR